MRQTDLERYADGDCNDPATVWKIELMSSQDTTNRVFKSAVDNWYYVLMVAVPIIVVVPAFFTTLTTDDYLALGIALIAATLPVWLLFTTDYQINRQELLIRSGPFRWNIRRADIQKVEPSRSLLSSPALSLDRLQITYGNNRRILVSPRDKEGFIEAVEADS